MNKIVRWQPANEIVSLRDAMDRLFEDSWVNAGGMYLPNAWMEPTVDVYETPEKVVVKAAIPGVKPEDVEISIKGNLLAISGEMKQETETKDKNYLRRETRVGSFSRALELPVGLKSDQADAKFENGVLTIDLPKAEEVKPKVIKIKPVKNGNKE